MHDEEVAAYRPQIRRLINLQTGLRWLVVVVLWATLGAFCLWQIRADLQRFLEFFTWSGVRILIKFDPLPAFGIGLCVAMTLSTLVWQSLHILWGFSRHEYQELLRQVQYIEQVGKKHPLWWWICHKP